jgi:hypothetical protein
MRAGSWDWWSCCSNANVAFWTSPCGTTLASCFRLPAVCVSCSSAPYWTSDLGPVGGYLHWPLFCQYCSTGSYFVNIVMALYLYQFCIGRCFVNRRVRCRGSHDLGGRVQRLRDLRTPWVHKQAWGLLRPHQWEQDGGTASTRYSMCYFLTRAFLSVNSRHSSFCKCHLNSLERASQYARENPEQVASWAAQGATYAASNPNGYKWCLSGVSHSSIGINKDRQRQAQTNKDRRKQRDKTDTHRATDACVSFQQERKQFWGLYLTLGCLCLNYRAEDGVDK